MPTDPGVDSWFAELDHPLKPVFNRIREVLLDADPKLQASVQYGTIQFVYGSPMCSFVQVRETRQVSLMFNAAGRLKGEFPHLEGQSVKYMRFRDVAEVEARSDELRAITAAWVAYKTPSPKRRG
ncbi:MAG TPA: DUF1801 domain-containing protein [Chloroflexota bacterium]|nr:DUF1801 domain-containing protein [Chloroflexota bacterium]